ncbi:unnamed protein product [Linum tenue]|uniref:NADP-dependent oxidoreductase domain-containing protein n=1 Tax=Linum tenue TaxID=586396 RepID=A0AAV0NT36_9ROSI|nr:unnamed protein product [Linum tenue]
MAMAMQVTGIACFSSSGFSQRHQRRSFRRSAAPRAAASEGLATPSVDDNKLKLGGSELKVTKVGIGAWSWGDTSYWNNFQWDDKKMKDAKDAFNASIDCGITLFDTAEVYGSKLSFGAISSETLLGRFISERKKREPELEVAIATKFAALPWRLGRESVLCALKDSLSRLGVSSVELYQLHWCSYRKVYADEPTKRTTRQDLHSGCSNQGYIDGLGDAVEQGLVKAVGVSNYSGKSLVSTTKP